MSAAADLIFGEKGARLSLPGLLDRIIEPVRATGFDPFILLGPIITMPDKVGSGLALALYELATNAVKHGALGETSGRVSIRWEVTSPCSVNLVWQETGGATIQPPEHMSFGMLLLKTGPLSPPHTVDIEFAKEGFIAKFQLVLDMAAVP